MPANQNPDLSLSQKIFRGGMWIFALRIISRVLGFIRTAILARLLSPHDFGLLGIALLSLSILETFSQTGFQAALIQKQEQVESFLDTVWTVSVIRGTLLFLILFSSAPVIVSFFTQPEALPVIQVLALTPLLTGFGNTAMLYFQKELKFDKQFVYELSGTVTDISVSIALAFVCQNVWALIWGGLAGNIVRVGMSYYLYPRHPSIRFEVKQFREMLKFGRWVTGSGILVFLVTQGDNVFVGKVLGTTALGLYQMAYMISNLPTTEITHVISQLTFPAYSKIKNDPRRFREAYVNVLRLTAFVSFPLAAGIAVLSYEFTLVFFGEQWADMIPAMQILAFAGLVRSVAATAGPLFYSVGKPCIDTALQSVRVSVLALFIWPLSIKWGIAGTSLSVCLSIGISTIGFCRWAVHISKCGFSDFAGTLLFPLAGALAMGTALLFAKNWFPSTGIFEFFLLTAFGVILYLLTMFVFDKYMDYGLLHKFPQKTGNSET